jgi:hypothetical protein
MRMWAASLLLMLPMPAFAQTGLEVESRCRSFAAVDVHPDGRIALPPNSDFCWGAFTTLQQFLVFSEGDVPMLRVCVPEKSTRLQLIKVFLGYSQRHPESAHLPFGQVVWQAMYEAFPCTPK